MSGHPGDGKRPVTYPSSDGERIAEHTRQFDWISLLWVNLSMPFARQPDVFVAADNLIYPVEGDNRTREAPDIYVAFGRPKGDRDSYRVWEEGGIFPQVVFEVRPPSPRPGVMTRKLGFYDRYGALEYYDYDPFENRLTGYLRDEGGRLTLIEEVDGFISPCLGIRFVSGPEQLAIYHPDGELFRSFSDWIHLTELRRRAGEARRQADAATRELERLRALCRTHGLDPDQLEAP
jgi:Uma2 family endonuclease